MKYYIDLDYTMLDTVKFHNERYQLLESYGIPKEEQKEMEKYIEQVENKLMNLDYLCTKLCEKYKLPKEEILTKLHKIIDNCYIYLYNDTIEFLEYLKSKENEIYVLTWGDKQLQEQKVNGARIKKYMNEVITTEELKYKIDIDYKNGIFIDDNPRDLEGLYANNPKQVIRIKRVGAKYSEKPINVDIKEYKDFKELQQDLEQKERNV
ncbi:MAG: HAD hydrolase-like protein [Clostridia bacterium]|nr:HAD hydrolase-like protein [Clostridia bacterium]